MHNLKFEHIDFSYDQNLLIQDFNFVFEKAKSYCILGSSGSGKTSVLRLIAGLETPQKGRILLGDVALSKDGDLLIPPHKRTVGFVFQDLALWPHFSVYNNIAFGLKERKDPKVKEKVGQMLNLFGITEHVSKFPHQLSGGQKQMVAISRSLVLQPDILLLDEPMANIDIHVKEHILEHLYKLQKVEGFTLVYVTHDHRDVEYSEQVMIMDQGRIVAAGMVEQIFSSTDEIVKSFIKN